MAVSRSTRTARRTGLWLAALLCAAACGSGTPSRAEADLGPLEAVVDQKARAVWPGRVRADGTRIIRELHGFLDGSAIGCWLFGLSSRLTADVFVFCREGDALCPLDTAGHAQWSRMIGDPVFARMPGEAGYSPYWLVWNVRVPADYRAGALKSVDGIKSAAAAGQVRLEQHLFDHGGTIGPGPAVMHCALVLAGTVLENPDADVVGHPGLKRRAIEDRQGWHKQYRVHFYDFSSSEGVGPADPSSASRPLMIVSDLMVLRRDCPGGSASPVCALAGAARGWVSEMDADTDFTHDGDKSDSNHVLMAKPFSPPADPKDADRAYSPLWRVSTVRVLPQHDAEVQLVDTTGQQDQSNIKSIADLRTMIAQGLLAEAEPLSEAEAGIALPGNDGQVYFSCPVQVPVTAP